MAESQTEIFCLFKCSRYRNKRWRLLFKMSNSHYFAPGNLYGTHHLSSRGLEGFREKQTHKTQNKLYPLICYRQIMHEIKRKLCSKAKRKKRKNKNRRRKQQQQNKNRKTNQQYKNKRQKQTNFLWPQLPTTPWHQMVRPKSTKYCYTADAILNNPVYKYVECIHWYSDYVILLCLYTNTW